MREYKNCRCARQRSEPHGRAHVIIENQKGGAIRTHATMQCHAVDNGAHGMLAHAKMKIAAGVVACAKVCAVFEQRFGGGCQVRRAAAELRDGGCERIKHAAACGACGLSLGVRRKHWQAAFPAGGQLVGNAALQFCSCAGVLACVLLNIQLPLRAQARACITRRRHVCPHSVRNVKALFFGPAKVALGCAQFIFAQRLAVRGCSALFVWCAVTDGGAHCNQ